MTPTRALRDDAGVIAIVVALSMSTFLLGFAALAVDMGSAYTRKAELKSIADRLALAGAKGLPDIGTPQGALDQIDQTLQQICQNEATPGVCRDDGTAPPISWADDGDPSNGEVTFLADADGNGKYTAGEQVGSTADDATALRVDLAPSRVEFGLAAAFGSDSATVHGTATSRIGTSIGSGILPFALTQTDLAKGQFCVRDPATPGLPPSPRPRGSVTLKILNPDADMVYQHEDETPLFIELTVPPLVPPPVPPPGSAGLQNVAFHLSNTSATVPFTPGAIGHTDTATQSYYTVLLPTGEPTPTGTIWATGTQPAPGGPNTRFTTSVTGPATAAVITYSGLPPGTDTLCSEREANRGFIKLNRTPSGGNDLQKLSRNIRSGPTVKLYPSTGLFGVIGDAVTCAATRVASATSCLSTSRQPFGTAMTTGFLTSSTNIPGRLIGDCGNDVRSSHSRNGVDDSKLFTDAGFVESAGHHTSAELKDRLISGSSHAAVIPDDRGWITSKVLRCPRLAVMPVIDPRTSVGTIGGQEIRSFRYVWIDNEDDTIHRGLNGDASNITSFRGYVIDPGYLSPVVSGSGQVGPFLGGNMPKEALLIADFGG